MSTERILLFQDNALKGRIIGDLSKFKKTFEPVVAAFEQLQLGNLTNDIYLLIADRKAKDLRAEYKKSVDNELTASGVKNPVLRNIASQGTDDLFAQFVAAANAFVDTDLTPSPYGIDKDRTQFLSVSDLSYGPEGLFISEATEEAILESYCRLYASTELEKQIYHALQDLAPALKNYLAVIRSAGIPFREIDFNDGRKGYFPHAYIEDFLTCDLSLKINIVPGAIKWAGGYKKALELRAAKGY